MVTFGPDFMAAVGNVISYEEADGKGMLNMMLCITNDGHSPFLFKAESISVSNANGHLLSVVPTNVISQNSGLIRGGYWGSELLAANAPPTCHHIIFILDEEEQVTPITVHVPIDTQAVDFVSRLGGRRAAIRRRYAIG